MLNEAETFTGFGISCIPIEPGTKFPHGKYLPKDENGEPVWGPFNEHIASPSELVQLFADGNAGIGAVCGPVSGWLEVMDFDIPDKPASRIPPAWKPFCELLKEHGHEDLLRRLICVETPSGGKHLIYRCPGVADGSQKLARSTDRKPLIETKAKGGYVLIPPTPGYLLRSGSFANIPEITELERETLHTCARLQNELIERVSYEKNYPAGKRPGDDYNLRGESMADLLMRHGWKPVQGREGRWANFTRPDKQEGISGGISASTGLFHVFTTSTPFDAGKGYSKFSVYSVLDHGGDFAIAARVLAERGFGGERERSAQVARDNYQAPKYPGTVELSEDEERELWGTLDEFDIEQVIWFWKNRIPMGALTMIQGDPGIGKSTITMAIAAAATVGAALPGGEPAEPCHVVLVATEDDPGKVIRPRLSVMGADLKQISVLATDRKKEDGTPIFDGMVTPEMVFRRVRQKQARLLIIDPLIETLAAFGIDPCKSQEVRPFLAKLRNMAEDNDCAVILVHHQNKMTGGKALYRSVGSIDIPAAMRSVFVVGSDPDAPEMKAMAHVKSNWAPLQEAIGYTVADGIFGWTGEVSLTAEDMSQPMQTREKRDKATAAREWLENYLKDGPVNQKIIESVGEDMGHSYGTLRRAKEVLGVKSIRRVESAGAGRGAAGKAAYYVWQLKDWVDHQGGEHGGF